MLQAQSISKRKPPFPDYLSFQALREAGIEHLQALSGQLWTDYNLHDPGVTILEVLCYAATDLGYRNNFAIEDLLARDLTNLESSENNFFTPDQILTCNPVTELDMRKRLIDVPGVRNAWVEKKVETEASILGLYTVYLDLEQQAVEQTVMDTVSQVLGSYRNLCEDVDEVVVLQQEPVAICADIELAAGADPEDVLVDIFLKVQDFWVPSVPFYTLAALLKKGRSVEDIFAGRPSAAIAHDPDSPYVHHASHGFIDTEEISAITLPETLYTSDLYRIIMDDDPRIVAIKKLKIAHTQSAHTQGSSDGDSLDFQDWQLPMTKGARPVLSIQASAISFSKGALPFRADMTEVARRFGEQQAIQIKVARDDADLDLAVPNGRYLNLSDHYSIHHDLPVTYGVGEAGVPSPPTDLRRAQANQLKGYLLFFDQLLANYLSQLAHIRDLFSWETDSAVAGAANRPPDRQRTYFTQPLVFPGMEEMISPIPAYTNFLNTIAEDESDYLERRDRFLDHLLARFSESFSDYVLIHYKKQKKVGSNRQRVEDKARFLQDYPGLSRDRFRAFNYSLKGAADIWDSANVSGLKRRVSRLLGIEDVRRRSLAAADNGDSEGFHLVEHILLRPRRRGDRSTFLWSSSEAQADKAEDWTCRAANNPYSFWISVVLPSWLDRFQNMDFRQRVEHTLRLEAPAHVALRILWIDKDQMSEFETDYKAWLKAFIKNPQAKRSRAYSKFKGTLSQLKNVYPPAVLHDCQESEPGDAPVELNRTVLGGTE